MAFGHQVSLGQSNTVILCPALTSHSEMSRPELERAGIAPTTIRIALGDEDPRLLIGHFIRAAELILEPARPGFCNAFLKPEAVDELYRTAYLDAHTRWLNSQPSTAEIMN